MSDRLLARPVVEVGVSIPKRGIAKTAAGAFQILFAGAFVAINLVGIASLGIVVYFLFSK